MQFLVWFGFLICFYLINISGFYLFYVRRIQSICRGGQQISAAATSAYDSFIFYACLCLSENILNNDNVNNGLPLISSA